MKAAVILMNLGTPVGANQKAVRAFLKEFLSDRRVVEVPRLIWMVILYAIILVFRVPKVTEAYQSIWKDGESPLRSIVRSQCNKLRDVVGERFSDDHRPLVEYAMTYAGPSLADTVAKLKDQQVDHIMVLPLYPQFSATTTGSIYDQIAAINKGNRDIPQIHVVKQYFDHAKYISALAASVEKHWQQHGKPDRLLMSFHSIPQKYADKGDPYYHQCVATANRLAEYMRLSNQDWSISFQSRLGFSKWLSPYTSDTVQQWGKEGVKRVDVICPAFSADCLETLEEIQVENRELFVEAGGETLHLIPCLNDSAEHIEMMAEIVDSYLPKVNS